MMNTPPLNISLPSIEATLRFGRSLGTVLLLLAQKSLPLRHVLLLGDLGSGKTTLVRGIVSALPGGDAAEVCSPSFTVCNAYPTTPPILHVDLYRDEDANGMAAGLPDEVWDLLDTSTDGVVLTEWAQRLKDIDKPSERLDISLESCQDRHLAVLTPFGERGHTALTALEKHLSNQKGG